MTNVSDNFTPFGLKLRELRETHNLTMRELASALDVSAPYLSALERGQKGKPPYAFVHKVIAFFHLIWDDAEELQVLASLSDPKVSVDTRNLSAQATELANILAHRIDKLSAKEISALIRKLRV